MEWVIGVVILGLAFMLIFRTPIVETIGRIKRVSKGGFDLEPNQSKTTGDEKTPANNAESLMHGLDNELVLEFEPQIQKQLEGISEKEQIKVLRRNYAWTLIAYYFLDLYRRIWGSQITTLEFVNAHQPIPRDSVQVFYTSGAIQYPVAYTGYSFDQWLGFLESELLLRNDGGQLRITVRGREFLAYLTRAGLPKLKIG